MKGRVGWIVATTAWAAYAASWFLPTVHFERPGLFSDIDAGWKAFLVVLSIVLKPEAFDFVWALGVASVLSNVVVVLSPWWFRRDSVPGWLTRLLVYAFLINLVWFFLMSDSDLLAGYWLWVGSMGLLAGVAISRRARTRVTVTLPPAPEC